MSGLPDLPLLFTDHLQSERERGTWKQDALHSSDLGHTIPGEGCLRQVWLRVHNAVGRLPTPGELLMWKKGTLMHEWFYVVVKEHLGARFPGWTVGGWEEAHESHDGESRLDLRLVGPDGRMWIWDLKSKRGRAFEYGEVITARNVLQLQDYIRKWDAAGGALLYDDREGSHFMKQYEVQRDDAAVALAWRELRAAVGAAEPPPVLPPKTTRKETKTKGDSVKVDLPWQCQYCRYADISCPTALPVAARGRVAGHVPEGADLEPLLARMLAAGSLHPEGETP